MKTDNICIHDGWQIVMAFKNNEVQNRYLWGAKQDELLCKNNEWALGDHLNTVRDVVKSDGSVVKHLEYNAFGECLSVNTSFPRRRESSQNDNELAFLYTGKLFDTKTGLQWNINRWYDAKVGRWCSEDPIGFRGRGNNLNSYISNNSVCKTDSFGLVEDDVVAHAILNQNDLTYIINGREESATLNTQAGAGFPPFNWRIGLDVTHLGVLYDIEEMTCCFKPKFTVYGVVAILIRPSDNQVASNPHTNDDIWAAWFVAESSTISPVPTSLDDYQSCVVNHEVQHYATFLEFLSISKTGLGALETCSSAEDEAEVKGQHGIAEFERLYNLASAHSKKYDGAWKSDSYKAERIHPFSEEFKIIY